MRRKEQEARIEQQRQEKEKAREDAARERARCADIQSHHEYILGSIKLRICVSHSFSLLFVKETEKNAWLPLVLLSKRLWKSCKKKFR